jgi:hypothetical protein
MVVVHRSRVLDALAALVEAYWERDAPIVIDAEGNDWWLCWQPGSETRRSSARSE